MDNKTVSTGSVLTESGIYIRGVVISNSAIRITKKDGGLLAIVRHEVATEPGMVVLQQFLDPKENPLIKIEGDEVTKFPKLECYKRITVRAEKIEDVRGQATVSRWESVT